MLRVFDYHGNHINLFEECEKLFGTDKVTFDKNLTLVDVSELKFVELYKGPCILRHGGNKDWIAVDPKGTFRQR